MIRPTKTRHMGETRRVTALAIVLAESTLGRPGPARAENAFQVNGFAAVRGTTPADHPLEADEAAAQLQAGLDWSPSPRFLAHLHLLARTDDGRSRDGHFGTPEAFVEAHLPAGRSRFKVRAGAFFLATWVVALVYGAGWIAPPGLEIGFYGLFGFAALVGWSNGLFCVLRLRRLPRDGRGRWIALQLLLPAGLVALVRAMASLEARAAAPIAGALALAVYGIFFAVPVSFGRRT